LLQAMPPGKGSDERFLDGIGGGVGLAAEDHRRRVDLAVGVSVEVIEVQFGASD
jgi:hypothetical protein